MANIAITSDAWTEISITSGTVQNISATADIELSAEQTDNSGVVLKPSEIYQWDNETIYARAVTESAGALRVVNFKKATGGGGSYVLPVATASKLGGVKVGTNLSIDENGVLSAENNYSTEEQRIGTWIDGKPLYQKTFECTSPSQAGYNTVVMTLNNNIYMISLDGFLIQQNNTDRVPINFAYDGGYVACWCNYELDNMFIRMLVSPLVYTSRPCYITLQYTKTTD